MFFIYQKQLSNTLSHKIWTFTWLQIGLFSGYILLQTRKKEPTEINTELSFHNLTVTFDREKWQSTEV